ncbi:MAG: septum formation initiator family protein [Prevotella sp.]|jgi:cell division protein FtsB|nr:septum formation initiator family protein [Prevotella sp.]
MDKKEFIQKSKKVAKTILHVNKYLVVIALGVLLVGFVGDNSIVGHMKYQSHMNELKAEIAQHRALTKANLEQIYLMQTDMKAVERVAREQHFMKMDDEDVFVLSDDDPTPQTLTGNETVE